MSSASIHETMADLLTYKAGGRNLRFFMVPGGHIAKPLLKVIILVVVF